VGSANTETAVRKDVGVCSDGNESGPLQVECRGPDSFSVFSCVPRWRGYSEPRVPGCDRRRGFTDLRRVLGFARPNRRQLNSSFTHPGQGPRSPCSVEINRRAACRIVSTRSRANRRRCDTSACPAMTPMWRARSRGLRRALRRRHGRAAVSPRQSSDYAQRTGSERKVGRRDSTVRAGRWPRSASTPVTERASLSARRTSRRHAPSTASSRSNATHRMRRWTTNRLRRMFARGGRSSRDR
jgi:hypothetical protein